ncbi:hypothetical protein DLJ53_31685 [Acuticoccus sediminis]|uniref:Microcystinase C n=1 Tax=Acuticoccus sediminis TaxID=2184697 RepID=A0A8B2NMW9_9HYPH|nr:M81 family metallopeptidase [Acuticoccus sediminis]RAH96823.1 hypothetical protein DLJ53_31685 [Acuticoccus sediminis]
MRVAVASLEYEGNSLSLRVDRRADFARKALHRGPAILEAVAGKALALTGGIDTVRAAGAEVIPVYMAKGGAGGHVDDAFFAEAMAEILDGIAAAGPLDGIYLALHGAMITASDGDPEGTLLAGLRERVGDAVPIAVSLDLHAHVSRRMARNASIVVGYETYPHVDAYETGARAASLLVRTMRGEISPRIGHVAFNAILPVLGMATLDDAPLAEVARIARAMEAAGAALSVSYFPVQPWLDGPDVGITGLAVTDGDAAAAEMAATAVAEAMWTRRRAFELPAYTPAEAVRAALAMDAETVLLVDASDSIGGGASGDSPAILAALLAHAPETPAAVAIVDPGTVERATAAGEGAGAMFEIGAWQDDRQVAPVRVNATVERLCEGRFTYTGGPVAGASATLGPVAVLRIGPIRVLAASYAVYEHMDEHYAACGIDISAFKMVSFKQLMNFRKLLTPERAFLSVHGPGATPLDLSKVDWHHRVRPFWPVDDPQTPPRLS